MQGKACVHVWVFEVSAAHLLFAHLWLPASCRRAEENGAAEQRGLCFQVLDTKSADD